MKKLVILTITILSLNIIVKAQIPSYVPKSNLIGWWSFNGNTNDESGNGNHGTNNGATLTSDRFSSSNKSYQFNGTSNYIVNLNPSFSFGEDSSFSVSAWANFSDLTKGREIVCNATLTSGNFVWLLDCYNGDIRFGAAKQQGRWYLAKYSASNLTKNTWYHFTGVYKNGAMELYVNGKLVNSTTFNKSGAKTATLPLCFGAFYNNSTKIIDYLQGKVDDIGIWDKPLTQKEVKDLYNACSIFTSHPQDQNLRVSNNAKFIAKTTDRSVTYQWQTNLGSGYNDISDTGQYNGTNKDTLVVSNVSISNTNQLFRCIINSNTCGDTSNPAKLTVAQVPNYVSIDSLQAWYSFTSNVQDESGNENHGTNKGATYSIDRFGNGNSAALFDGIDDHVIINNLFDFYNKTINLWFLSDSFKGNVCQHCATQQFLIGSDHKSLKNGANYIGLLSTPNPDEFFLGQGVGPGSYYRNAIDYYKWTMVTISHDNDSAYYYLNGVLIHTSVKGYYYSTASLTVPWFNIGGVYNGASTPGNVGLTGTSRHFNGKIDDLGIWSRNLTECEIQNLYYAGSRQNKDTLKVEVCNSYISPSGKTLTSSGAYNDTLTNYCGFDSILNISLKVNKLDTTITKSWKGLFSNEDLGKYQWLDCRNNYSAIIGDTNQIFKPTKNGDYALWVKAQNGCSDTTSCYTFNTVGLKELQSNISIFPNPTSRYLNITIANEFIGSSYEILDPIGKKVLDGKINNSNSTIDVSVLSKGYYLFKIANTSYSHKFIVK